MFGLKSHHIFFFLFLAVAIYVGVQVIPLQFRAYQFSDFVYQEVKFAATSRKTTEKIRGEILDEARRSEIPITVRDIVIKRHGPSFTIDIDYQMPADLYVYRTPGNFHVNASGEIFDK